MAGTHTKRDSKRRTAGSPSVRAAALGCGALVPGGDRPAPTEPKARPLGAAALPRGSPAVPGCLGPFFVKFFLQKRLTNPRRAYNIRKLYHKAWIRTSNRCFCLSESRPHGARAAGRARRRSPGSRGLNPCIPRGSRLRRGRPLQRARVLCFFARNGSGTAEVYAFVSHWGGRGVFVSAGRAKRIPTAIAV